MKKLAIIFLIIIFQNRICSNPIIFPQDFDSIHVHDKNAKHVKLFKNLYQKNNLNNLITNNRPLIPLKIHQIWIGPKPLPEKFKWMIETWKEKHKEWEYKLWTNEDLKNFKLINQNAFNNATNWGTKADILRYEIIQRYGGVYVDIDFECLKPLDILNYNYEFYCGLLWEDEIANGFIAAKPNHPILNMCIKKIQEIKNFNNIDIIKTTGPGLLTKVFIDYVTNVSNQERIIALPSSFLFPFPAGLREQYWSNNLTKKDIENSIHPHSFAVHYWAMSWVEK